MEKPVIFENKNGEKLLGIVHIPEQSPLGEKKVGINLLNPGIKYRVAPNRLNVKLARRLCESGYYVLRFDPEGIGDSEGELPEGALVPDIWEKIQTGLFVSDTIVANDFFIGNYKLDELVLIGSCGGAITSLLTSAQDERIEGLCLIDVPVNLRAANMSFADKIAEGGQRADWLFSEYMRKLLSLKSWSRLISLKTDFRSLRKILAMKFQEKFTPFRNETNIPKNIEVLCRERKLNRHFFDSYEAFAARRKPILFVLAGNDPGTEFFQCYFQNGYLKEGNQNGKYDNVVEVFLIEKANHVYTLYEWQKSLTGRVHRWTCANFDTWTPTMENSKKVS